jgi:L-ascorbate metabolism protein UlaG (beta-lactamase superfamily)
MNSILFSAFLTLPTFLLPASPMVADSLEIRNFGHSSILIKGKDQSVLLNPFRAVGCASGLVEQNISADIILASSLLPDEGAKTAKGLFMVKPGSYRINGLRFEGFSRPHDRVGGRRFGMSTIWRWKQNGLTFAHLGGAASPLTIQDRLLIGKPDILFIAVGGGSKVYDAQEAANVVEVLKPKIVIPVQYQRKGKDKIPSCDQQGVEPFFSLYNLS